MTQKKSYIPQTSRVSFTISKKEIKEIKKFAIDFDMEEKDVPVFALGYLINAYTKMTAEDRAKGLDYFWVQEPIVDTENPEDK